MTPRPGAFTLAALLEFAGRIGRGAAVDEKSADTLELAAGTLRAIADSLDAQARRLKGEAAQHSVDEAFLVPLVRELEARVEQHKPRHKLERPPSEDAGVKPLTSPERDSVERFLEKHPNAGRPAIVAATGITEWRVRRYLAGRMSLTGEAANSSAKRAGGISSTRQGAG